MLLYFYIAMLQKAEDNWATKTELFSVALLRDLQKKTF